MVKMRNYVICRPIKLVKNKKLKKPKIWTFDISRFLNLGLSQFSSHVV